MSADAVGLPDRRRPKTRVFCLQMADHFAAEAQDDLEAGRYERSHAATLLATFYLERARLMGTSS